MANGRSLEAPTGLSRSEEQDKFARKAYSARGSTLPASLWAADFSFSQPSKAQKNKLFRSLSIDEISQCHQRNSDLATVMEALETAEEVLRCHRT